MVSGARADRHASSQHAFLGVDRACEAVDAFERGTACAGGEAVEEAHDELGGEDFVKRAVVVAHLGALGV